MRIRRTAEDFKDKSETEESHNFPQGNRLNALLLRSLAVMKTATNGDCMMVVTRVIPHTHSDTRALPPGWISGVLHFLKYLILT